MSSVTRPEPEGSFVPVLMAHDIASVVLLHVVFRTGVPIGLIDDALPQAEMAESSTQRRLLLTEMGYFDIGKQRRPLHFFT